MVQASPTAVPSRLPFKYTAQTKWSAEDTKEATRLYMAGKTYVEIGLELGKSKGQVAGRLNRINILRTRRAVRPSVVLAKVAANQTDKVIKFAKPLQQKRVRLRVIESDTAVTFAELKHHMCRWPLGDPRQSDFRFCGCSRVNDRTPYCSEHSILAGRRYEKEAQAQK